MNYSAWIDPRIDQVTVAGLRGYLEAHGWRLQPFPKPELLVFEGPNDDSGAPLTLAVPASERLKDYRLRLEELLGTLGLIEGRYAGEILNEMLQGTPTNGAVPHPQANGVPPVGK